MKKDEHPYIKIEVKGPYNKKDWAEVALIFLFLFVSVLLLGIVGGLLMKLIVSLI